MPVQRIGSDAARLPLPGASVDAALSTWTLCTVPDVEAALSEVRRVLRPGGRLHLLEHGLSPDARVARWQHRLDGLQGRLVGGCHVDRPVEQLVRASGLRVERLENRYERGSPEVLGYLYEGVAVA